MASKQNIIAIRTMLTKLGIEEDDKQTLVHNYTEGKTVAISEMSDRQAWELRAYLHDWIEGRKHGTKPQSSYDAANKMRRKIISKYREMNYHVWNEERGAMVADMPKIQAHLKVHWKKELNDYTNTELATIISVLEEKFLPWFYKNKQNG
jgi:hypothetical protein